MLLPLFQMVPFRIAIFTILLNLIPFFCHVVVIIAAVVAVVVRWTSSVFFSFVFVIPTQKGVNYECLTTTIVTLLLLSWRAISFQRCVHHPSASHVYTYAQLELRNCYRLLVNNMLKELRVPFFSFNLFNYECSAQFSFTAAFCPLGVCSFLIMLDCSFTKHWLHLLCVHGWNSHAIHSANAFGYRTVWACCVLCVDCFGTHCCSGSIFYVWIANSPM